MERQGHIRFWKLNLDEPRFQKAMYLMQFTDCLFDCEPKMLCFVDTKQKVEKESMAKSLSSPSESKKRCIQFIKIKHPTNQTLNNDKRKYVYANFLV